MMPRRSLYYSTSDRGALMDDDIDIACPMRDCVPENRRRNIFIWRRADGTSADS